MLIKKAAFIQEELFVSKTSIHPKTEKISFIYNRVLAGMYLSRFAIKSTTCK